MGLYILDWTNVPGGSLGLKTNGQLNFTHYELLLIGPQTIQAFRGSWICTSDLSGLQFVAVCEFRKSQNNTFDESVPFFFL